MAINGLLFGILADTPIHRLYRIFLRFDFIPFGSYSEDTTIYGKEDSATSYQIEVGTNYQFSRIINILASLQVGSHKAKFEQSNAEFRSKDTALKLGATYSF